MKNGWSKRRTRRIEREKMNRKGRRGVEHFHYKRGDGEEKRLKERQRTRGKEVVIPGGKIHTDTLVTLMVSEME